MEMIKKNIRIIAVIFCIDLFIAIGVILLNNSTAKDDKSSSAKTTENADAKEKDINPENPLKDTNLEESLSSEYASLQTSVNELKRNIASYVSSNPTQDNTCISLSTIYSDPGRSGSVYLSNNKTNYTVWFENGTYVLNGIEINKNNLKDSDISYRFDNAYYDNCGENN